MDHNKHQEFRRRKKRGILMGKNLFVSACIFFLSVSGFLFTPSFASEHKPLTFKKQPEIQRIKPKKPVKIKLKRLANGTYTWDLTGVDVEEILNIDRQLREQLKIK
jgi:hypothetical protein